MVIAGCPSRCLPGNVCAALASVRCELRVCLFLLALCVAHAAQAGSPLAAEELGSAVVQVHGTDRDGGTTVSVGLVVTSDRYAGYVLAAGDLVARSERVEVRHPRSGALLQADTLRLDGRHDIAILKVNGLEVPALQFAITDAAPRDIIWSATVGADGVTIATGEVIALDVATATASAAMTHTAATERRGAVLFNECGEVLGFDTGRTAVPASSLQAVLSGQNLGAPMASARCNSALTAAQQKADAAAREARLAQVEARRASAAAEALERELAASNERNEALVVRTRTAQSQADSALEEARSAQANAETTRLELERKTASIMAETQTMVKHLEAEREKAEARFQQALREQKVESEYRELLIGGVAVAVIVVLLAFFFLMRDRPAKTEPPVRTRQSASTRHTPDDNKTVLHEDHLSEYVLDGRDEAGIRYLLRISGEQLSPADGVVIGRNPRDARFTINHADVSRQHARLRVMKNRVFIEDMGSTNGTSVNGQSIEEKGPVTVGNGDQIIIGSVVMKLRVLDQ